MFNVVSNIFGNIFTRHSSSFLSSMMIFKFAFTWIKNLIAIIFDFLMRGIWLIIKWILGVVEGFEYIINSFLGINMTLNDYQNFIDMNFKPDVYNMVVKTFKAMVAVALVLLIVFTIIAIVRQEFANAEQGFESAAKDGKSQVGNEKGPIMKRLFRNLVSIALLPISMILIIVGVNSVLGAFSNAVGLGSATVAGQILNASTYDSNKYRKYANAGQRVPIIISAYSNEYYAPDRAAAFALKIKSVDVQNKLSKTAQNDVNNTYLTFEKSLSYQNNKISNSADYGDFYEQFVCTAEQYRVMADFVDYAELYNLSYTIKSIDDPEISWKYVDDVVYEMKDGVPNLTINYKDASDINGNGREDDIYTMVYAPSNEVTSPISDALDSIMAMLGAGEYSDNVYNTMERDDSGNFLNLVQWANEKAMIKLSPSFNINASYRTWSKEDQVIVYELNHFSSNNTFGDATLETLMTTGIELDVKQIVYRDYYPEADAYSPDKTINCVYINGSYYPVKVSIDYADKFGNSYYELDVPDDVNFLSEEYSILRATGGTATVTLSGSFDINKPSSWTTKDQIILYEYYKDLTYHNTLSAYKFSDFDSGVSLPTYSITVKADREGGEETLSSGTYILINGTYYRTTALASNTKPGTFMQTLTDASKVYYDFRININDLTDANADHYKFVGADRLVNFTFSQLTTGTIEQENVALYFSKNFNFRDTTTWSYKDYFIFYLYLKYNVAESIDEILYCGVLGDIVSGYFKPHQTTTSNLAIPMSTIESISDLNISTALNTDLIFEKNIIDTPTDKLFVSFDEDSSIHIKDAESRLFELSKNFDYYDVSTWTTSDLILMYLSSKGTICDRDALKSTGYYALKITDETAGVVYRFGAKDNANTVYLSEKSIDNLKDKNNNKIYSSFNVFLRDDAYSFICNYLGISEVGLISTKEELLENVYKSYDSYILDSKTLVSRLLSENYPETYKLMTEYTYRNDSFDIANFSTWTNLDLAIYCITGRATGIYKSYLVRDADQKDYFIVKDKAILVSEGAFQSTIAVKDTAGNTSSLAISSKAFSGTINTLEEMEAYIESTNLVKTSSGSAVLSSALKYTYTATASIDRNSLGGDLSGATVLDVILAYTSANGTVIDGATYKFNIYTDGIFNYIKHNGYYISIKDNAITGDTEPEITFKDSSMLLTCNTETAKKIIKTDGSYTYDVSGTFSYLDTIIYEITGSLATKTYNTYKINDVSYINVDGVVKQIEYTFDTTEGEPPTTTTKTVDFTEDIPVSFNNLSYSKPGDGGVPVDACDQISYLYRNYYSKYLISGISSYDEVFTKVSFKNASFQINDVNSWTPLGLIFNYLSIQSISDGSIYRTGESYFLSFTVNISGVQQPYFIDITNITSVTSASLSATALENDITSKKNNDANKILKLRTYYATNLYGITGLSVNGKSLSTDIKKVYAYDDGSELLNEEMFMLFNTHNESFEKLIADVAENTSTETKGKIKNLVDIKQTFNSTMDLTVATSWTWFDLVYYNLTEKTLRGNFGYYVYVSNNELYAEIDGDIFGKAYALLNIDGDTDNELFEMFTSAGTEPVTYSDDTSSVLAIIYNKLQKKDSGTVEKYNYSTALGVCEPFYLINDISTGITYGVYKLPTTSNIGFAVANSNVNYVSADGEDVSSWNVFDFVVYYAKGHTKTSITQSNIYSYNSKYYFKINDLYIDIHSLGYNNSLDPSKTFVNTVGSRIDSFNNLGGSLKLNGGEATAVAMKKDDLAESLQDKITYFYQGNQTITAAGGYNSDTIAMLLGNKNATYTTFSQDFDPSDYKTWTMSDILIYYSVISKFYEGEDVGTIFEGYINGDADKTQLTYFTKVFQSFINNEFVPAYVYNLVNEDEFGNANVNKVINLSNKPLNPGNIYFNYDVFTALKTRRPASLFTIDTGYLTSTVLETNPRPGQNPSTYSHIKNFVYEAENENNFANFVYNNYYFFNLDEKKFSLYELDKNIKTDLKNSIAKGTAKILGTVNLSLHNKDTDTDIDINNVNTWNLLQLIAIYEFSRPIENNEFKTMTFEDLFGDNYFLLYASEIEDDTSAANQEKILFINGNFYNLSDYLTKVRTEKSDKEYRLKTGFEATTNGGNPSNKINDLVIAREAMINEVITANISLVKGLYTKTKAIENVIGSTGLVFDDTKIAEYKTLMENIEADTNDSVWKEAFTADDKVQIQNHRGYLDAVDADPAQKLDASSLDFLRFLRDVATPRYRDFVRTKIEELILSTPDANYEYKYEEIRDTATVSKIVSILTTINNFEKEETAGSGTYIPIENEDDIEFETFSNLDEYKSLIVESRKFVVDKEKLASGYSISRLKSQIVMTIIDAFNTCGVESIANDAALNSIKEAIKNSTVGNLTEFEKALLVGQEAGTSAVDLTDADLLIMYDQTPVSSTIQAPDIDGKYTKAEFSQATIGSKNLPNILMFWENIKNEGYLTDSDINHVDKIVEEINNIPDSLFENVIKAQTKYIASTREIDQKLALSRTAFVEKPSQKTYDYGFSKLEGKEVDIDGCKSETEHKAGALSIGTVNNYTFRANYEQIQFVTLYSFNDSLVLGSGADSCSYEKGDTRIYRSVDYRVRDSVKINLKNFGMYDISPMIKKVSWPQKLMEDMQVLYPDLNWATLIATDGWLDTLGEFTSAYANGQFISKGNSANTTAAGLVLSEFFLSKATKPVDGFADFEYDTLFDEKIIKSLMLSLMGEESYTNLSQQATVFMEMFNSSFAPILEDIARENNYEIVDGKVDNFTMCVYKSYLATVLLSSDIGEYLYTIATRIYAQYTIYESLACSTGDYAGYFAYTSGQLDENGKVVDKFTYGSFFDLVKYENILVGNSTPIYTFSTKKAYVAYRREIDGVDKSVTDQTLLQEYNSIVGNDALYRQWYYKLFDFVDFKYESAYNSDKRILDTDPLYCFMFETYWAMKVDCYEYTGEYQPPEYLKIYRQYLTGEIIRWGTVKDVSTNGTDKYISKYEDYKTALTMSKIPLVINLAKTVFQLNYPSDDVKEMQEKIESGKVSFSDYVDLLKGKIEQTLEANTTKNVLRRSLGNQYQSKVKWFDIEYVMDLLTSSEEGSHTAWLFVNEMYSDLSLLVSEIGAIKELVPGDPGSANKTQNGSIRIFEGDEVYDNMLDMVSGLYQSLGNYISSQKMLDKIVKSSITFTLGQYGQSYVTTGYEFNIESRNYTFNPTLSASRLAEYVYGGSFLLGVNVLPVYTDGEYEGLVRQSKQYDPDAKALKVKLEMWPELRQFASNLANYTAKIYYQTNLKDLSTNIIDNVKLTDYVRYEFNGSNLTVEYAILKYMLEENNSCKLDDETFIRIMFADTTDSLTALGASASYHTIANYLAGLEALPTGTSIRSVLSSYLDYVASPAYTAEGKYNSGSDSPAERIHKVFKNVMGYLLVAEDKETEDENPVNLDDITFKEFKMIVMERIIGYEQNLSETGLQNSNRYLTLFDLLNCEVNYKYNDGDAKNVRVLTNYLVKDLDGTAGGMKIELQSGAKAPITAGVHSDRSTRNVVLTLAGIANRPIEELVNLEYDELYDRNGNYDEALGDVFVCCFFDMTDGKYYPYLAKGMNVTVPETSKSYDYFNRYREWGIETTYYNAPGRNTVAGSAYPIIAKGAITANGYPTAIRLVEGDIVYYRTQVLATTTVNEEAVMATQTVSEVNTIGFVGTVESTSNQRASGTSARAMFISSSDLSSFVKSDVSAYFMQNEVTYKTKTNDFGEISVLDQFPSFYKLTLMVNEDMGITLLIMAFMSVIPIMFKATAAVMRRILDIAVYILMGPVIISMTSFDYQDKGIGKMAFDRWKQGLSQGLVAALGYIIGFNLYYILAKTTLQMTFVSEATFANIERIGGLGFITQGAVEMVVRFMFMLTAASMIEKAGNMLLKIISGGKYENAFASPIGGKDVVKELQDMANEAKQGIEKLGGIVSGKAILEAKSAALQAMKTMVPGAAVVGSVVDFAKDKATNRQGKKLEKAMKDKGISGDVAKAAAESFKTNKKKQRETKSKQSLERANSFMSTYMGAKGKAFSPTAKPLKSLAEGFKYGEKKDPEKEKKKKPKKDKVSKKKKPQK